MKRALVLNADYTPFEIVSWKRAIIMAIDEDAKNAAYVLQYYDKSIRDTAGRQYYIPAVLILKKYVKLDYKQAPYTKLNILCRDKFVCQYCGVKFEPADLTLDHVIPRSKWKLYNKDKYKIASNFENIVTSCRPCNRRKGNRMADECKMYPIHKPKNLTRKQAFLNRLNCIENLPSEWVLYIKGN